MKKFIVALIAIFIATISMSYTAMAQWQSPSYHDADELTGQSAYYANLYVGENGYFVCWSNTDDVKISTKSGIFDYNRDNYVSVIIGFYEGDKLTEKVTTKFYVPRGDSDVAICSKYNTPKDLGKKIVTHIKTKGSVRIIASKFSGSDFDLTIPMNEDMKVSFDVAYKWNDYITISEKQNLKIVSADEIVAVIKKMDRS